jgi:hypothetical protein
VVNLGVVAPKKQTFWLALIAGPHVRRKTLRPLYPPTTTAKADFRTVVMSALPPKADMCSATSDVCFGPLADIVKGII